MQTARPAIRETTHAILLRKTKLTETSLIVTWFTAGTAAEDRGKGRAAEEPLRRVVDLFSIAKSSLPAAGVANSTRAKSPCTSRTKRSAPITTASRSRLFHRAHRTRHRARPSRAGNLSPAPARLPFPQRQPVIAPRLLHFESELVRLGIQGQPGVTPAVAIGRAYQRIPPRAQDCWGTHAEEKSGAGSETP